MIKIMLYMTSLIFISVWSGVYAADDAPGGRPPISPRRVLPESAVVVVGDTAPTPVGEAPHLPSSLSSVAVVVPPTVEAPHGGAGAISSHRPESVGMSVPAGVSPMLQSGLSQAIRNQALIPNTLDEPSPLVYNTRRCMLSTAQMAECGLRPLAYVGAAVSTVFFVLAATVDPVPLLQSPYFVYGVWASSVTGGITLIKQGTPNLVRDLQQWVKHVDDQRAEHRAALEGAAAPRVIAHYAAVDDSVV